MLLGARKEAKSRGGRTELPEGQDAPPVSEGQLNLNWLLGAFGTPSRCRQWGFDRAAGGEGAEASASTASFVLISGR